MWELAIIKVAPSRSNYNCQSTFISLSHPRQGSGLSIDLPSQILQLRNSKLTQIYWGNITKIYENNGTISTQGYLICQEKNDVNISILFTFLSIYISPSLLLSISPSPSLSLCLFSFPVSLPVRLSPLSCLLSFPLSLALALALVLALALSVSSHSLFPSFRLSPSASLSPLSFSLPIFSISGFCPAPEPVTT